MRKVIFEYHDKPQAGHPGFYKTWLMVREHFTSRKLRNYINRYTRGCDMCQRIKSRPRTSHELNPTETVERPWEQIFVDLLGPLPADRNTGEDTVLVISDKMTKQVHYIPTTQNLDAEGTADLYLKYIWRHHGIPKRIISDRGPQFSSKFMTTLLERVGSKASLSTSVDITVSISRHIGVLEACFYWSEQQFRGVRWALPRISCPIWINPIGQY